MPVGAVYLFTVSSCGNRKQSVSRSLGLHVKRYNYCSFVSSSYTGLKLITVVLGKDVNRSVTGTEDCGNRVTDGTRSLVLSTVDGLRASRRCQDRCVSTLLP